MRKKLLVTILALVLALSLTGAASALTYGYIAYQMSDIWNEYSSKAFQYAADQNGVDVVILDSQNDIGKSVAAMESLVQQEVDGISIFPISPEQGAQLITMANEAGIPITVENIDVAAVADEEESVRRLIARRRVTYPVALDVSGHLSEDYGITGVPETFVVAGDDTVAAVFVGPLTREQLVDELERLVGD